MKSSIEKSVLSEIKDYFSNHSSVLSLFLLGSAARGELRKDSDIDLAILPFNGIQIKSSELYQITGDLGYKFGYDFDLGIMSSENLVYSKEAIFNGIRIYTKDEMAALFRINTLLSMYYHFQFERQEVVHAYQI
ncbi:MAG: nucleotidyltransferase domain-containing protein [Leptospiraceae bacterium]|nr:nucleotidyltransferase domain-containing protein [Leptospiraceae bacterium]